MTTTFPPFPPPPTGAPPAIPPPPATSRPPEPRRRRGWHRVVAFLAGIGALLTVLWGCLSLVDVAARTTTRSSRTVAAAVLHLDLDGGSRVTILGERRDDIRIDRTIHQGLRPVHASERFEDGELHVDSNCPIFLGTLCRVDYELRVPIGIDVSGHTDGGSMRMVRLGAVHVSSGGGSIDLERTTGPIDVRTGGGSIDGRAIRSARFHGRSGGGSIDVRFAEPPRRVDVSTGGGNVDVVVPDDAPPFDVDARTGGGSTRIEIPTDPAAGLFIRARSGGGSIEVKHPER